MKLIHEYEDCFIGILIGVLLIGLSERYLTLPDLAIVWGIAFIISAIFTILDIFHTISDLGNKIFPLFILFLNHIIDIALELALAGFYFNFNIPYLSDFLNPYLADPFYLFIMGIFFVVSSLFWIIATPIIWKEPKYEKK